MVATLKQIIKCTDLNSTCLYDGAHLPNGQLVVTDWIKEKLLLFDDSVTLQEKYDLGSDPRGVCVSADGSLIYVMHYDMLRTYKLQGGLREVSHFNVQWYTTGVGMSGDTFITGQPSNITLHDKNGKKLFIIMKKGYNTCISVSKDGSRFYHKDGDHIVCRTVSDLSEVFRYSHPKLKDPWGMDCDRHGNILVAGWWSGNIIMIDKDGTKGRVLIDKLHGISRPSGVSCHPQRDEFVVFTFESVVMSYKCRDWNAMEVYEMK